MDAEFSVPQKHTNAANCHAKLHGIVEESAYFFLAESVQFLYFPNNIKIQNMDKPILISLQ